MKCDFFMLSFLHFRFMIVIKGGSRTGAPGPPPPLPVLKILDPPMVMKKWNRELNHARADT